MLIAYHGLRPEDSSILQFPQFIEAVEKNGYILTNGEEIVDKSETDVDWLIVVDPVTNNELHVIVDDIIDDEITLAGFREVLKAMDEYCKENNGERLFEGADYDLVLLKGYEEFDWEFDFSKNAYIDPNPSTVEKTSKSRKNHTPTFSEVFGMSVDEFFKNGNTLDEVLESKSVENDT